MYAIYTGNPNDWTWDSQETLHEDFLIYECACIIWTNVVGSFIE